MERDRLKILLSKYLTSSLDSEETEEFKQLMNVVDQRTLYELYNELEVADPFIEEKAFDYDHVRVLGEIQTRIKKPLFSNKKIIYGFISTVSVILLFFTLKLAFFEKFDGNILSNSLDTSGIELLDSTGVTLQLANGEIIDVQSESDEIIRSGYLIGLKNGTLQYKSSYQKGHSTKGFHVFTTQKGAMSSIILEDGTKVWLNSASSLKFPITFEMAKHRTVEVTGEAYFEVAHNENKPFIVSTGSSKVTVLGTKFNVRSYEDQGGMQTTLVEGLVRVNSLNTSQKLVPGQQASIGKEGGIRLNQVNIDDFIAWKTGLIKFNNLKIKDILLELSRWYDIEAIDNLSMNKEYYTGSLRKNKDVSVLLKQLEQISNTKLIIKERRVLIRD